MTCIIDTFLVVAIVERSHRVSRISRIRHLARHAAVALSIEEESRCVIVRLKSMFTLRRNLLFTMVGKIDLFTARLGAEIRRLVLYFFFRS